MCLILCQTLHISRDFCVLQIILSPTYIAQLCFYLCCRIISIFQSVRQGMFYEIDVGKKSDKYIRAEENACSQKCFTSHGDLLNLFFFLQKLLDALWKIWMFNTRGRGQCIFRKLETNYLKYKESPIQP